MQTRRDAAPRHRVELPAEFVGGTVVYHRIETDGDGRLVERRQLTRAEWESQAMAMYVRSLTTSTAASLAMAPRIAARTARPRSAGASRRLTAVASSDDPSGSPAELDRAATRLAENYEAVGDHAKASYWRTFAGVPSNTSRPAVTTIVPSRRAILGGYVDERRIVVAASAGPASADAPDEKSGLA